MIEFFRWESALNFNLLNTFDCTNWKGQENEEKYELKGTHDVNYFVKREIPKRKHYEGCWSRNKGGEN